MENFLIDIVNKFGYFGIGFLILIENLFPPIPSEIVLTFGGFMTISSNINIIGVIISATIGSVLGACILYYFGKIFNKERLIRMVNSKWGHVLCFKENDIIKADDWFDNRGYKTVFYCRFIPVVRSLISIPAGMSEMFFWKFVIFTFCGSAIWNTVLILIGAFAGNKKDTILELINKFSYLILIIIILGIVLGFIYYKKRKKRS